MKIYSKTHTITDKAGIAVKPPLGANGRPLSKTAVIDHPAGTVLEMDDEFAQDLIDRGVAEAYQPDEHEGEQEGVVSVTRMQLSVPLPEGQTHPAVVRQDETLNDGPKGTTAAPVVHFDVKDAEKAEQAKADAAVAAAAATKVAAEAGNAAPK